MSTTLTYLRIYSDDAGISHFAPVAIEAVAQDDAPSLAQLWASALQPASRHGFLVLPSGWIGELHPAPVRMWIVVTAGEIEFEAGDGAKHRLAPGSALLLEDITGMGHRSHVIGDQAAVLSVVHV
ncbi:MAG TPA: cupin domain-containing protein [Telluria sp.]|nr:cupin domain-containing protein [Telluria sp.]